MDVCECFLQACVTWGLCQPYPRTLPPPYATHMYVCIQVVGLLGDLRPLFMAEHPGEADTMENLQHYLYARIRDRLHIVLSMSPEHPRFSDRLRRFPALMGCCTIDWFLPWPHEALLRVAQAFLEGFQKEVGHGCNVKRMWQLV